MKHKLKIILVISLIFYITLISIGDCVVRQEVPGVTILNQGGGGGSPKPSYQLDVNFTISKKNTTRGEPILLTAYYYINDTFYKGNKDDITKFSYVEYLNKKFMILAVDGIANKDPYIGKIEINGTLNISDDKKTKNWTLITDLRSTEESVMLFDILKRKIVSIEGKSKKRSITIAPNIMFFGLYKKTNVMINIKNNPPIIDKNSTKVKVISPQISDDKTLIYWDLNNLLETNLLTLARDKEDNEKLQYTWTVENDKGVCTEFTTNLSNSINQWRLKYDENYIFRVKAKDPDGDYSESITAKIVGSDNNTTYTNISVPSWEFYRTNLILILIVAGLLVFLSFTIKFKSDLCIRKKDIIKIIMYKFKKYIRNITMNPLANAFISAPLITIIFIYLFTHNIHFLHIYSTSLAFYELYPFIIIYIFFGYLAEEHFFKTDKNSSKYNIIFANDMLMIFILASFYGISSGITQDIYEHLSNYYTIITQFSGTLLGLILGFYIAKFDRKERSNIFLKTLEYLVLLYGTIIILSLWGLSLSESFYFTPIIELNQENLANIVSIWVFESTLLLVPLAITSLYRMIKIAS